MKIELDTDDLRPLVESVADAVIKKLRDGGELANEDGLRGYTERQAAERLGVAFHVLRDARLRGEITATRLGRKWIYGTETLRKFLESSPRKS